MSNGCIHAQTATKNVTIEYGTDVTNFVVSTSNKGAVLYYSVFQVDEAYNLRLNTTKSTSKLVYSKKMHSKLMTKAIKVQILTDFEK